MSLCLNKKVEMELRALPGNNVCCDCEAKQPQWASVSFGTFMCLECSGRHRALGVHISFVRSVSMDSWTEKQIEKMRLGGNQKCIEFLKQYGVPKTMPIPQKYNTPAAQLYRDRIDAAANGLPLPTELPAASGTSTTAPEATGSDPLPGETEAQYVARQRRLQEEARARMRAKFGSSSGLSSSGSMQGIGSDPNYRRNTGSSSGGGLDMSQVSEALSFVGSSLAVFGEQVTKATQEAIKPVATSMSNSSSYARNDRNSSAESPWASWTANAADLWKQATEVTSDIVDIISKPEEQLKEEEFKFPRPTAGAATPPIPSPGASVGSSNTNSASAKVNSGGTDRSKKSGVASSKRGVAADESWDDLDDFDSSNAKEGQKTPPRGKALTGKTRTRPPRAVNSNNSLSSLDNSQHSNNLGLSANPSTGSLNLVPPAPPSSVVRSSSTPASLNGGSSKKLSTSDSPSGDDFFSTFGV